MFLKEVEGTLKMTTFRLLTYSLILPGDAAAFWKTLPGLPWLPGLVTPLLHRPSSKLASKRKRNRKRSKETTSILRETCNAKRNTITTGWQWVVSCCTTTVPTELVPTFKSTFNKHQHFNCNLFQLESNQSTEKEQNE